MKQPPARRARAISLASALAVLALPAAAHDTWFEPLPGGPGDTLLALGTGTRYPLQDTGVGAEYLARQGCRTGDTGAAVPMKPLRNAPAALVLRVPRHASTCWAQLTPFEIELPAATVEVYFRDIQPPPEVRAAWAALQQRGLPWRERYTKHARIELGELTGEAAPTPMDMDLHLETGGQPLRVGATLVAQALRDGAPLPGLALELRSELSPYGLWRRTDAQGRVSMPLPLAGHWVLRGTDLRLSESDPTRWESRFVTLAFEVPAADQNGSSLTLNALSTNQVPATTAISSDPPTSTARR